MSDVETAIVEFLTYGYCPSDRLHSQWQPTLEARVPLERELPDLHTQVAALRHSTRIELERISPPGNAVVPLSGGLDSRVGLALALEHFDASRIHAVTFGLKTSLDFRLGRNVARSVGVQHHSLDLGTVPISLEALCEANAGLLWSGAFDAFYNSLAREYAQSGDVIMSGFGGDTTSGKHAADPPLEWTSDASSEYAATQYASASDPLSVRTRSRAQLPAFPSATPYGTLTPFEAHAITTRLPAAIHPIVVGSAIGRTALPLVQTPWLDIVTSIPAATRRRGSILGAICEALAPRLMRVGLTEKWGGTSAASSVELRMRRGYSFGRSRLGPSPLLNYIDYDRVFRDRPDYQHVASTALSYLDEQALPLDESPSELLAMHLSGGVPGRTISHLISLAIHLMNLDKGQSWRDTMPS